MGGGEGEGGLDRSGSTREGVDEGQSTSSLVHPGGSKLATRTFKFYANLLSARNNNSNSEERAERGHVVGL